MTTRPDISPDDAGLAAEYAMGLLDGAEKAEFEARLAEEAGLRAEVLAWEMRLAVMAEDEISPVAPPRRLEAALNAQLFAPTTPVRALWREFELWRGATFAALVAAVAVAAVLYTLAPTPETADPGPRLVAQLQGEDGGFAVAALYDTQSGVLEITRAAGAPPEGRAQELWIIAGDAAPVSLGLLDGQGRATIAVPEDLTVLMASAVLAVSDEPAGGSPTGAPTGEVLAAGPFTEL